MTAEVSTPVRDALAALRSVVGNEHVRAADPRQDEVNGVPAGLVVAPGSVEQTAAVMRTAADLELRVVPRGGGSKMERGAPPAGVDLLLDTGRLDAVLEHAAGDLVVSGQAGVRLADLQERLAPAGQWLALDPPQRGASLGGIIATNASGPRRLRYGTTRDLLIGVTVVLADGTVARAGGKVVKNVAGYDLGKLYTGSFGTLGVVVEAVFRLHPLPAAARLVTTTLRGPGAAGAAVQALLHSQLVPSAAEVLRSAVGAPLTLAVLIEGTGPGVDAQSATLTALLRDVAGAGPAEVRDTLPAWWAEPAYGSYDLGLKMTALPSALPEVLAAVDRAADRRAVEPAVRGRAATGVTYVGLPALDEQGIEAAAGVLDELRAAVRPYGGSVVVVSAPPEFAAALDIWGPMPAPTLALMAKVKERFDPGHRLAPGRFVGGM